MNLEHLLFSVLDLLTVLLRVPKDVIEERDALLQSDYVSIRRELGVGVA